MRTTSEQARISAIVPTIGRPASLERLLVSLARQTRPLDEVVIADGSGKEETSRIAGDSRWGEAGLKVTCIPVQPPHAVRQREAAIAVASGDLLLLLDDDVELEPECLAELVKALEADSGSVAVMADFNNQAWPLPTRAWRIYMRLFLGIREGEWQGRVVGPLLRFGFNPPPREICQCDWLGTCNSIVRREAFERAGGFSDFFLHRSTMNEDVDLGLRVAKIGRILFSPHARLGHFHDPAGRVTARQVAEDDIYNRFHVLNRSVGRTRANALRAILAFSAIESLSNLLGAIRHLHWGNRGLLLEGRLSGLRRVLRETK